MGIVKFLRSKLLNRHRRWDRAAGDGNGGESCSGRCGDAAAGAAMKRLGWGEIERITGGFAEVVGKGGFSTVYLGRLRGCEEGSAAAVAVAAVKVHCGGVERLSLAFKQELDVLLRLKHQNIVRLLGYCDDADQGALIFEYVSSGTLHEHLHGRGGDKRSTLPWKSRVKIAYQLARAIEYLHERCTLHIIHGDIKSSNILLDGDSDSKLCDFGSAKMGFSSLIPPPSSSPSSSPYVRRKNLIMGSPGYTDPAYLRTGIASKKNDIYSFGVVVLELVTGLEAFRADKGQVLASMAARMAKDVGHMDVHEAAKMVDPRLRGDFDVEEARALIELARSCFDYSTLIRPTASCVVKMMKEKVSSISFANSNSNSNSKHKLSFDL
ncbi:probable receptor-like protein kinase At4g10390 [Rhodamnia argentea]|uniref:Probable receptor-like protein kinase At4g10390 n=1 Tax=Rhodamnia argentea TaxID=178133 RepID=A0A8B8PZG5_9MYRT|nr:probable receptor-like protein kinase At4g10390 [Rhodamnia argentea]